MTNENSTLLIQFNELQATANVSAANAESTVGAIPDEIEKLRHRLVGSDFRDSVDLKVMIVGELVYLAYKDLITRKRFL